MLRIDCPNCGVRNAAEFRHGGEYNPRPTQADDDEWIRYLYLRRNRMGVQVEWWYHRFGCGTWFLVERDRRSDEITRIMRWQPGVIETPESKA